ncbi:glycosyltransferase involved in cell wall biosynthesis [Mucilaginibacter gracilis]|uniref:Glycosyltransferase involved in cell wall biosynthesis n=1 Tax=Mucilaginibacter gracilis TaxID=423350 RepID=A0A495IX32_9SPHI|nr:glycosyltransferase family 4 protein [Mucilaginibacter gracilis]RKR81073.1 glycosyltransferase involved in cell wall biosynthesis [Mucilaginibacter gracilis]
MKVAIVQEWLTTIGGSEKVVQEIAKIYPEADLFTLVAISDTVDKLGLSAHKLTTSFIQKLPFAKTKWRTYLPLFPLAIEQFDLSSYDLIISSSHSVAKGVLTNANQTHICYCHSPIRYAWDLYHPYLKESGLDKGLKGFLAKYFLHRIRFWDIISTNRVDFFISNSNYIGKRIKKIYDRDSFTIYPNVAVDDFALEEVKDNYYFTCSRLVPYKKIDLIVKAFSEMPDKTLVVIGDGPDMKKIVKLKTDNIQLLGFQQFDVLKKYMSKAKAFVFAAEEDFGIVPVEAQACGTPVIAFGKGGALETIIENKTGVLFYEQNVDAIKAAVLKFEALEPALDFKFIRDHSQKFSSAIFAQKFKKFVDEKLKKTN